MPPRDANIRHQLDEIENLGRSLTKWEESFVADIADQFDRTGSLSDRQKEILERIYEERV